MVYGSQDMLVSILSVRFHQLTPKKEMSREKETERARQSCLQGGGLGAPRELLLTLHHSPPSPRSGRQDHQERHPHAHEKHTHANDVRLTPHEQRGRCREQEPCPDDAEHQCPKVGAQPQHASNREAGTLPAAPIRGETLGGLKDVRKAVDSDERKP